MSSDIINWAVVTIVGSLLLFILIARTSESAIYLKDLHLHNKTKDIAPCDGQIWVSAKTNKRYHIRVYRVDGYNVLYICDYPSEERLFQNWWEHKVISEKLYLKM
jgi:hypothetical protein